MTGGGVPGGGVPGGGGGELARRQVGELVGQLSSDDLGRADRGRLLLRLTRALAAGAKAAGARAALSGRLLTDAVTDVAPHLPVRDLLTLRSHHGGLSGDDLAEALTSAASKVTAGIGAASGALATAEMTAPPALLGAPVQLLAETLAVVAVELKLVAELHVVYGRAPQGSRPEVAVAYLSSWAAKRGIDPRKGAPGLTSVLSTAAKAQLRSRLMRRAGRNLTAFAPLLTGAVAGAELNRRETRSLGEALIRDLHRR